LKNLKNLEIIALVCLMLPAIAVTEGAPVTPQWGLFNVTITGQIVTMFTAEGYLRCWGTNGWRGLQSIARGIEDSLLIPLTINKGLLDKDGVPILDAEQNPIWTSTDQAHFEAIIHDCYTTKVKKDYIIDNDFWDFFIYWKHDVDGDGVLDRVELFLYTDDDPHMEGTYSGTPLNTVTVDYGITYHPGSESIGLLYTLRWWKLKDYVYHNQPYQAYELQGLLNTDSIDKLSFTVTIVKQ